VEGAVPGDVVDVSVTRSKKDWAEGRVLRFHTYSAQRVPAFCDHLVYVEVVSGRCCRMSSSWRTRGRK
jgi:tRNA/tmRNA/rRNA uracil-C5-methylase (TrmA/RlmC/RlmD family)